MDVLSRIGARLALALLLAACFSPVESDGVVRCGADGACPSGYVCHEDQLCWLGDEEDPPDAAPPLPACANGLDDDCDGDVDRDDEGCKNEDDRSEGHDRCVSPPGP